MQTLRKTLALLLCLCMVMPYLGITPVHAAEGPNVSLTVDNETVNVGDTVTVEIRNADLNARGFGIYMEFDKELLECTNITGADGDEYLGVYFEGSKGANWADGQVADSVADTNKDGRFSFGYLAGKDTKVFGGIVAKLTFTAKAKGTVTITLTEDTDGIDGFTGVAGTATVEGGDLGI